MYDYNIEFGHIYIDQTPGSEQSLSLTILKQELERMDANNTTHVEVILIDDISPNSARLDIGAYTATAEKNMGLDFIFLESTLGGFKDQLLAELPQEELLPGKKDSSLYIKSNEGVRIMLLKPDSNPTCSFYVAVWFLGRLGIYKDVARWGINLNQKEFAAKKLLTILSEQYRSSDEQALAIIEKTPHAHRISDIEFKYFSV